MNKEEQCQAGVRQRSRRTVYLSAGSIVALKLHEARQKIERRNARDLWQDRNLVFCTEVGGFTDPAGINLALHRRLKAAGLPKLRVHDLRHTAATYLLSLGVHPKVVQDMLGHSSIALTLNTYSHVVPPCTARRLARWRGYSQGRPMRPMARWMLAWMLGTEIPLSGTLTPSEIWRPDGENMAAAGFEPATKGWYENAGENGQAASRETV